MAITPPGPGSRPPSKEHGNVYEFSYAVKDPKTGEWRHEELTPDKQSELTKYLRQNVLHDIRPSESRQEFQITEKGVEAVSKGEKSLKERKVEKVDETFSGSISSSVKKIVGADYFRMGVKVSPSPQLLEMGEKEKVVTKHLSEPAETERRVYDRFRGVSQLYTTHQNLVRANLRARGLSDLDISYLLDPFYEASLVMKGMSKGLEEVKKLAQEGKFSEAMKIYGQLIVAKYAKYSAALSKGVIANKKASKLAGVLHEALQEIPEFAQFFTQQGQIDTSAIMIEFVQRLPRHELLLRESLKQIVALGVDAPKICRDAESLIASENKKVNSRVTEHERLTELPSLSTKDGKAVFKHTGWSGNDSSKLAAICQVQAEEYTSIYQGVQVLESTEKSEQRPVLFQLKQLVKQAQPRLERSKKQLDSLHIDKKLTSLEKAIETLKGSDNPDAGRIAQLESLLGNVKKLSKDFEERELFVDNLAKDLHLRMNREPKSVERILLNNELAKLEVWKESGWTDKDVKQFSRLYDSYTEQMEPIYVTMGALEADPENLALQADYTNVVVKQMSKLNKVGAEIQRFDGKGKIKQLTTAINRTRQFLAKEIEIFDQTIVVDEELRGQYESLKSQLDQAHFESSLAGRNLLVGRAYQDVSVGLSGEEGHVQKLLIDSGLVREPEFAKVKDLAALDKWNNTFVKEMGALQKLQRSLEVNPGDDKTFQTLKNLIRQKKSQIDSLKEGFEQWGGIKKAKDLQEAIDSYVVTHPGEKVVLERVQIYRMMLSRTEFLKGMSMYHQATSPFARIVLAA